MSSCNHKAISTADHILHTDYCLGRETTWCLENKDIYIYKANADLCHQTLIQPENNVLQPMTVSLKGKNSTQANLGYSPSCLRICNKVKYPPTKLMYVPPMHTNQLTFRLERIC